MLTTSQNKEMFLVLFLFLFFVILLIWSVRALTPRRPDTLPPGPKPKFLIGNIGVIRGSGSNRLNSIVKAVEKYGDGQMCTIYMGQRPYIFISDYETIKRVVNDDIFTGRPKSLRDHFFHRKGLIFTDGDLWREQRRFALSTLRDLGMGKNWLQDLIIEEAKSLVEDIKAHEGQPINPAPFLTTSVSNIICAIAYGKRFDHNDEKFRRLTGLIGQNIVLLSQMNIVQFFPYFRYIPFTKFRNRFSQLGKNTQEVVAFLRNLIEEHQSNFQPGENSDYIHSFMTEANKRFSDPKSTFTDDQLEKSIFNLFGAGTETTSTTLAWAFVYLLNNPNVFRTVQAEVDNVLRDGQFPTMDEKESLPYLQATIMEVQRMANLVPIVGRTNTEAVELNGYLIPANTTIMPLLNAVHMNPLYFPDPELFKPDRFLDELGRVKKPDGFIPFSLGKRYCIGESLAKMELYIFLTSLVKHFNISLPAGQTVSPDDSVFGLVNSPKPFQIIFKSR